MMVPYPSVLAKDLFWIDIKEERLRELQSETSVFIFYFVINQNCCKAFSLTAES